MVQIYLLLPSNKSNALVEYQMDHGIVFRKKLLPASKLSFSSNIHVFFYKNQSVSVQVQCAYFFKISVLDVLILFLFLPFLNVHVTKIILYILITKMRTISYPRYGIYVKNIGECDIWPLPYSGSLFHKNIEMSVL